MSNSKRDTSHFESYTYEERCAWDRYAAAGRMADPATPAELIAIEADNLLAKRRERFGRAGAGGQKGDAP